MTRTSEFLAAFRKPDEALHLRGFKPKKTPDSAENKPFTINTTLGQLTANRELQRQLVTANQNLGIYHCVNVGAGTDESISRYTAFFCETDDKPKPEQHALLDRAPLPPSIRVVTRASVHSYWLLAGACSESEWRDVQARLISFFDSDPKIRNPSRVMRLPGFDHLHLNGDGLARKRITVHTFEPSQRYTVAEMRDAFPAPEPKNVSQGQQWPANGTFEYHEDRHEELCQRIMSRGKRNSKGNWDTQCFGHNGNGKTGLVYFPTSGAVKCNNEPACNYWTIIRAEGLPDGHLPSREKSIAVAASNHKNDSEGQPQREFEPERHILTGYADFMSQVTTDAEIVAVECCRGEVALIQSITNKGKSTMIRNVAFCLAAGREFGTLVSGTPRRVLLVNFEGARGRFQSDLRVMERVFDETEKDRIRQNFFPTHAPEFADEPLSLSRHMKIFEAEARAVAPDVIIIDTASAAFNIRNESDNSEVSELMKTLIRLARHLNCVIVIVHHIGKAKAEDGQTREAAHRGRGASAWADFSSSILNLECDQSTDLVTLTCGKRKTGTGENYETVMRLDRNSRWFAATSDAPPRPLSNREQVLRVLREYGSLSTGGVEQALAGKMSERTVRTCLSELVADGLATQPKRGHWAIRVHKPALGNSGNAHRGLPNCLTDNKGNISSDLGALGRLGNPLYELPKLPNRENYREPTKEEWSAAAADPQQWSRLVELANTANEGEQDSDDSVIETEAIREGY